MSNKFLAILLIYLGMNLEFDMSALAILKLVTFGLMLAVLFKRNVRLN